MYADVHGFLPPGFMSIDIAKGLGLSLYDRIRKTPSWARNAHRGFAVMASLEAIRPSQS